MLTIKIRPWLQPVYSPKAKIKPPRKYKAVGMECKGLTEKCFALIGSHHLGTALTVWLKRETY